MLKNKKGFTLIEIMVVVAVLSILVLIAVGVFSNVRNKSAKVSCQTNRYRVARLFYQISGYEEDLTMQDVLDNVDHKYFQSDVSCPDGGVYTITDNVISCSIHGSSFIDANALASFSYNFSNMSDDDIEALLELVIAQGNDDWDITDVNGQIVLTNLTTGENRIFFPIEFDTYTITSNIQLDGNNGYGIMVEAITDNNATDSGFIFQFDPSYGSGYFVFRERSDGREYSPFERINPADIIPNYDADTFWNEKHEVVIDIIEHDDDQNQMIVYIDGVDITALSPVYIDKADSDAQNYVGFRTWGSSQALIDDLEVVANDG